MADKTFKITVKVAEGDEQVYIKHFIDMVYPCFEQFKQKIFCRFPNLREKEIKLYWIDLEKDQVTIFNEEDFRVFIDQSAGTNDRLYVVEKALMKTKQPAKIIPTTETAVRGEPSCPRMDKNLPVHVNVSCDSCGVIIHGYRYKCLECPNYDLCMDCDKLMFHREHSMIRFYLPIDYSNWSRGSIDRLSKIIRKRSSKCRDKSPPPVVGEVPEGKDHSRRRHRHGRCPAAGAEKPQILNIFKYMHDFANAEYGIPKEETPIYAAEEAAKVDSSTTSTSASAPASTSKNVFDILSEITRPLGFELNILPTPNSAPTAAAPEKKEDSIPKEQTPPPAETKKPSEAEFENYSAQPSTSKPKDVEIEIALNRQPIFQGEEIFESHNNMSASMVNIEAPIQSREPSPDSDKEWDVIDEEITLDNLEKRRNSPPAAGAIPKATAPEILSTKNSSTNTSSDDIPKYHIVETQSNKVTLTPPPTPRETAAGERNGNNVNFPNFEKLGRDLHKHIQEQMAAPVEQTVYHRQPHINSAVGTMLAMGFSNEGGWLIQLLESVDGNISRALDMLQPIQRK